MTLNQTARHSEVEKYFPSSLPFPSSLATAHTPITIRTPTNTDLCPFPPFLFSDPTPNSMSLQPIDSSNDKSDQIPPPIGINSSKPDQAVYQYPTQLSFHEDPRITSTLILLPTCCLLIYAISHTVEIDRDYNSFFSFIPVSWLIALPFLILNIAYGIHTAITYPFNSRLITKYWVDKATLTPHNEGNTWLFRAKLLILTVSFLLQAVMTSASGGMAIGNFLRQTVYIDMPTMDASWSSFWLYLACTILFCATTTFTAFSWKELYRSRKQFEKWSRSEPLAHGEGGNPYGDRRYAPPSLNSS